MSRQRKHLFAFADFRLDPLAGMLFRKDAHIPLAPKVVRTLVVLVEHRGEVLSKDQLMKAVWPDTFVEEGNLTVNIHSLRKALGDGWIETVPRRGYRFTGEVQVIEEAVDERRETAGAPAETVASSASGASGAVLAPRTPLRAGAILAAVCLFAAIGLWMTRASSSAAEAVLVRLTDNVADDSQPDISPDGRHIVFVSNRDGGKGEIYLMDADGRNLRNLTHNPAHDDSPAWSPDGRQIVFQSNRRGSTEIFVINADGGDPRPLGPGGRPAWSPDGRQIAFSRVLDHYQELFVMSAAGGEARRLTFDQEFCADPSWSPDGKRIVFTSGRHHTLQVEVMNLDGTGRATLTSLGHNRLPAWSPDGQRIVFNSNRAGKDSLYVMEADGSQQRRISPGDFDDQEAAWTHDGRSLVFQRELDSNTEIYRMRLTNEPDGAIRITRNVAVDDNPSWSPDGKAIAFWSNREGQAQIFLMDPEGGEVRNLTRDASSNLDPEWSHDGSRITFTSDRGGGRAVYEMNADGSSPRKITEGPKDDSPHRSPDGRQICFSRDKAIWIVPAAGGAARKLVEGETCSWSSDGTHVFFDRDQETVREIFSIPAAGGQALCLTNNGGSNGGPAAGAGGSWIVFNSNRAGAGFGLFLMKPDGSAQTRITGRHTFDEHPAWSPDGRWIAFVSDRDGNREIYKIAVPRF